MPWWIWVPDTTDLPLNISQQQQVIIPSDYCLVLREKKLRERKSRSHLLSVMKGHKFNGWDHHRWSPVKHEDFLKQRADSWQEYTCVT